MTLEIKKIFCKNFAAFSQKSWELGSGFQWIYGPNESGKTTMLTALRLAFYGYSGREQDLSKNLRKKYSEHGKQVMVGVEFHHEGKDYRLQRILGKSQQSDRITLYRNPSKERLLLPKTESPGHYFFDLDENSFLNTIFFRPQGGKIEDPKRSRAASLEDRILQQGNFSEDANYSDVYRRLDEAEKKLRNRRGEKGRLDRLEKKIQQLDQEILEVRQAEDLHRKESEELFASKEIEKEKLIQARQKLDDLTLELGRLMERKNDLSRRLHEPQEPSNEEANDREIAHKEKILQIKKQQEIWKGQNSSLLGILALLVFSVFSLLTSFYFGWRRNLEMMLIFMGIFLLSAIGNLFFIIRKMNLDRRKKANLQALARELSSLQGEAETSNFRKEKLPLAKPQEERKLQEGHEAIEHRLQQVSLSKRELEEWIKTQESRQIAFAQKESGLEQSAQGRGNSEFLKEQRKRMISLYREDHKDLLALQLAKRCLEEAKDRYSNQLSPSINQLTSDIYAQLTGTRKNFFVGKDWKLRCEEKEGDLLEEERLSSGAREEAYFALRYALQLTLRPRMDFPLILDDPFVYYDDLRAERAMCFLQREGRDRQILYVTAHRRGEETIPAENRVYL